MCSWYTLVYSNQLIKFALLTQSITQLLLLFDFFRFYSGTMFVLSSCWEQSKSFAHRAYLNSGTLFIIHTADINVNSSGRLFIPAEYNYAVIMIRYHSATDPSACLQTGFFQEWGFSFSARTSSRLTSTPMPGIFGRET